MLMAEAYRAH